MQPSGSNKELPSLLKIEQEGPLAASAQEDLEQKLAHQRDEFSLILDISKLIVSELNLDTVLNLVAEKTLDLVQAETVLIPMLDERQERYTYLAAAGNDADGIRAASFPIHVGMCGWVLKNKRSLLFGDSSPFPMDETTTWERGQPSALLVPLLGRKRIIGGLSALGKKGGGSFSRHDLELMTMFANQVSTAIENAVLFRQIEMEIEERKRSEAKVRENERFIMSILESIGEGLIVVDRDFQILAANRAYCELAGAPLAEVVGRHCYECSHQRTQPCEELGEECAVRHTFQTGEASRVIHTHHDPHGNPQYIEIRSFPLKDAEGGVSQAIEIMNDITEKRKIENQLNQAQKMDSLGTLAGGIAHDMNNVLGAILGLASANIGLQPTGSPTYRSFETIVKAATRGGDMVRSLLTFARQSQAADQVLDVNALLREEVQLLERTTLAKVQLEVDLEPELQPMRGDPGALAHAFMNLCVNAVEAMPESGTLVLRSRNIDSDWIEVVVEDTGGGMTKEVLARAMEPFFTTKEVGKGTGLGLSMVYSTVKAHLGQIEIHSAPGQGTQVRMRFPACERPAEAVGSQPTAGAEPSRRVLNVLLVDDDELIQSSMEAILETLGHAVTTAPSGEAALAAIDGGLAPDVVILDMNMPGLGGSGTLPRLRATLPEVPVLLSTGRADQAALNLAEADPQVTLLPKPFTIKELQEHLAPFGRR
jgi:PAS domain S-box-containing protein